MKKTKKYIILRLIISTIVALLLLTNISNGRVSIQEDIDGGSPSSGGQQTTSEKGQIGTFSDWQQQADDFLNKGSQGTTIDTQTAIETFLPIGRVLVGIATVVLVIVGSIIGVKYMLAGADEKAKLKEKLIFYVISIVLVYGAVGIFTLVVNIMNGILA